MSFTVPDTMKAFPDDFDAKTLLTLRDDVALDRIRPVIVNQLRLAAIAGNTLEWIVDVSELSAEAARRIGNELCQRFANVYRWNAGAWIRLSGSETIPCSTNKLRILPQ